MPIGYFRDAPKIDIKFDDRQYRPGEELRVTVVMHSERPGLKVRRGVIELVMENRYTHVRAGRTFDARAYGAFSSGGPVLPSPFRSGTITEERVDRDVQGREEFLLNAVLRHRTEIFHARFTVKAPPVRRTMERRASYLVSVHMDIPRMRDIEVHKTVPVKLT